MFVTLTPREIFPKNFKKLIDGSGKTRKDIAIALGVTPVAINDWLHGKRYPRPEGMEAIAKYFCVPKSTLIEPPQKPALLSSVQIGDIIRAKREEKGLTHEQLAEQTGITLAIIKKWEKGKIAEPRIDFASKLAKVLGLATSTILGVQEDEKSIRRQRFRTMLYEEIPDLCLTDDEIKQVVNYIKFVISQRT